MWKNKIEGRKEKIGKRGGGGVGVEGSLVNR